MNNGKFFYNARVCKKAARLSLITGNRQRPHIGNAFETEYEEMLGFAQTHQGFALDPPPFEKGGPKL